MLTADGGFHADMTCDLDALALGASASEPDGVLAARLKAMPSAEFEEHVEQLRSLFRKRVRVRFDGRDTEFAVSFPAPGATEGTNPSVLGVVARLSGRAPPDAESVTFWASRAFMAVHLDILREGSPQSSSQILRVAAESQPYWLGGESPPASRLQSAWRYLVLGFEHILPLGLDHVLFVLGLFLLGTRLAPLLWQVTAFTVAHSVTLALAIYGVLALPARVVEPLIALSIAYVAIENIFTSKVQPWRLAIVFGFGLLHGLGFAGVLAELGLPPGERVTALLSFNVGVEFGQLAVVLLALMTIGWFRKRAWYRARIVIPLSALIAAVAVYWTVERVLF